MNSDGLVDPATLAAAFTDRTVLVSIMRPDTLRRYATEAGFTEVRILPIDTDYWRFCQLVR